MKTSDIPAPVWYVGGLAVAGIVAYYLIKKGASAVGDAGVGAVKGIGSVFGIPDTNATQCQKDMAAGHTWSASFSCDASTFFNYLTSPTPECADCAAKDAASSSSGGGGLSEWLRNTFSLSPSPESTGPRATGIGIISTPGYDYGQGGDTGVPYAPGVNRQPDPLNLTNWNWTQT